MKGALTGNLVDFYSVTDSNLTLQPHPNMVTQNLSTKSLYYMCTGSPDRNGLCVPLEHGNSILGLVHENEGKG